MRLSLAIFHYQSTCRKHITIVTYGNHAKNIYLIIIDQFLSIEIKRVACPLHKVDPFNRLLKVELSDVLKDRKIEDKKERQRIL